jgi:hypothetical protein
VGGFCFNCKVPWWLVAVVGFFVRLVNGDILRDDDVCGVKCKMTDFLTMSDPVFQCSMTLWESHRDPAPGKLVDVGGVRLHIIKCYGRAVPPDGVEGTGVIAFAPATRLNAPLIAKVMPMASNPRNCPLPERRKPIMSGPK